MCKKRRRLDDGVFLFVIVRQSVIATNDGMLNMGGGKSGHIAESVLWLDRLIYCTCREIRVLPTLQCICLGRVLVIRTVGCYQIWNETNCACMQSPFRQLSFRLLLITICLTSREVTRFFYKDVLFFCKKFLIWTSQPEILLNEGSWKGNLTIGKGCRKFSRTRVYCHFHPNKF